MCSDPPDHVPTSQALVIVVTSTIMVISRIVAAIIVMRVTSLPRTYYAVLSPISAARAGALCKRAPGEQREGHCQAQCRCGNNSRKLWHTVFPFFLSV